MIIKNNEGSLRVGTKLDEKGFKNGYKKLTKETQKMHDQYNKQVGSIKKQEIALDKVKNKLNELYKKTDQPLLKKTNESIKNAEKELDNLQRKLIETNKKISNHNPTPIGTKTEVSGTGDLAKYNIYSKEDEEKRLSLQNEKNSLNEKIIDAKGSLESLKKEYQSLNKVDPKIENEIKLTNQQIQLLEGNLRDSKNKVNDLKSKLTEAFKIKFSGFSGNVDGIKENIEKIGNGVDRFRKKVFNLVGTVVVFNMIRKSVSGMTSSILDLLKSNRIFSNNLNQIKANLWTAFAPIYTAILPAINSLMNALSQITGSIASFIAGLFGKTAGQAKDNAKQLYNQAKATRELGKAQGDLADFDKLKVINDTSSDDQPVNFSSIIPTDDKTLNFLNKIKDILSSFDTSNLQKSLSILWNSFKPFSENVGEGLKWLFDNVLMPLTQWTINDLLPSFLNILAGALDILNQAIVDITPIFSWLWKNIFQPMAQWTGGVVVSVLNGIGDALKWISDNETAMTLLESIAIAIGLVAGALALYNGAMLVANIVTGIFSGILAVLTSPITLVVLAIAALIAIIVLCVKHFETIKTTAINVWETIKQLILGLPNYFRSNFGLVGKIIGDVFETALNHVSGVINSITRIFSGLKDFIVGIFTGDLNMAFRGLGNVFGGVINGILTTLESALNFMVIPLNALIKTFNSTLGKIPGVPNLPNLKISIPKIPKLATGAVIPPGQEFMAILGDQRNGRNLEAPEGLIRKIVREESGSGNKETVLNGTFILQFGTDKVDKIVVKGIRLAEEKMGKPLLVN